MQCSNCGTENRDDARFCRECGVALAAPTPSPEKDSKSGRTKALLALVVIAAVVGALAAVSLRSRTRNTGTGYETYLTVQESVGAIEEGYRNEGGFHDPESVSDLLDEIEQYGKGNATLVSSVDRGVDYVEFSLSDGTLYVFVPTLEGMLSGGVDCSIVTLEPWWTNVGNVDPLRLDAAKMGVGDDEIAVEEHASPSAFDSWANEVSKALEEYSFAPGDNVDDSEVTIERLGAIGQNQFVFYLGHGGPPSKSHGPFLTTGEAITEEARERYSDDLASHRLVQTSSGRFAVTDKFFSPERLGDEAFSNTDFFLLACHSCQDERLADALLSCGARTVTGFTESVKLKYGIEMLYGILGLDDNAKGLLDVGDDGQYLTFAESIENARSVYGDKDPYASSKWYQRRHPAEVVCLPEEAAKQERLHDASASHPDADRDVAVNFVRVWYDDWTFADGHEVPNANPIVARCSPLIAEDSPLYGEFVDSCTSMDGRYSRGVATCVLSTPSSEELSAGVFRVTVRYLATQNSVDQKMYDSLLADPREDVWDVTVGKDGLVVALARVAAEADEAEEERVPEQDEAGGYVLSGTVRSHEEPFYDDYITVVSMTLDEPVGYTFDYKGTVSDTAYEVELETSRSDTYGQWASYDGKHITVECEGLHGAIHDASMHGVDTVATGTIELRSIDGPDDPQVDNGPSNDYPSPFDKRYWAIYTVDALGDVEVRAISFSAESPTLIWDQYMRLMASPADGDDGLISLYTLLDSGEWEKSGETVTLDDMPLDFIAANFPVERADGVALELTDYIP